MEKGSNQAGVFIRCSVRDSGGKSYSLMFPEGKGVVGVWWWGSGPSQISGVDSVRRWAITQWNIKNSFAVVNLGRGLWLFEFESKEEVDRVLMYGKRRFGTNLVHLRIWGEDMGCSSQGDLEEKAWVRVVGLPVHLWSRKVMEKIGDACGDFLAVDEDTDKLGKLG